MIKFVIRNRDGEVNYDYLKSNFKIYGSNKRDLSDKKTLDFNLLNGGVNKELIIQNNDVKYKYYTLDIDVEIYEKIGIIQEQHFVPYTNENLQKIEFNNNQTVSFFTPGKHDAFYTVDGRTVNFVAPETEMLKNDIYDYGLTKFSSPKYDAGTGLVTVSGEMIVGAKEEEGLI